MKVKNTPALRQEALEVTVFDDSLKRLAVDMHLTMAKERGVGLAAPQVGVSKRLILVKDEEIVIVMVNPKIFHYSASTVTSLEGCLSLPGAVYEVPRSSKVSVSYRDLSGALKYLYASKLTAIIIQHEVDHLNGILIDQSGKLVKSSPNYLGLSI